MYSYPKYYKNNGAWEVLNENFADCGDSFCNDQLFSVSVSKTLSQNTISLNENSVSFTPLSVGGVNLSHTLSYTVEGNKITFYEVIPFVDVEYYYVWNGLKEVFVIKNPAALTAFTTAVPLTFISHLNSNFQAVQDQEHITLTTPNNDKFIIKEVVVYDANGSLIERANLTLNSQQVEFAIDSTNLLNPEIAYPVYVDPTIQIDFGNISWNGDLYRVDRGTGNIPYSRTNNPSDKLHVGRYNTSTFGIEEKHRSSIEWNITILPPNIGSVDDINFTFYVEQVGEDGNERIDFVTQEQNNDFYEPENITECGSNCQFWGDLGNETALLNTSITSSFQSINLSVFTTNLLNSIQQGLEWWGFGIASLNGETSKKGKQETTHISPRDDVSSNQRPLLTITYTPTANETEGNAAIEQGILNQIPTATIYDEQKTYTRDMNNLQKQGQFDKLASYNNQRWAINYVTDGESFVNMSNLSTTFFTLELANLTTTQITSEVEAFINGTLI